MNGELKRKLIEIGINVDEVLERLLGHEDFYIQLLQNFAADDNFQKLQQALIDKNPDTAFKAAHTLKGLSSALSITVLLVPLTQIIDTLRNKNIDQALVYMENFSELYRKVISIINSI